MGGEQDIRRRWTVEGVAGAALGVAGLALAGFQGLWLAIAAFSFVVLAEVLRERKDAPTVRRDAAVIALTLLVAASCALAWSWPSITARSQQALAASSQGAIREVFDELQYNWAKLINAEKSRVYDEATPLATAAFDRHEDVLSAVLPFGVSHAIYIFYSWAHEIDAEPSGLAGPQGGKNFKTLKGLLAEARSGLAPYVG